MYKVEAKKGLTNFTELERLNPCATIFTPEGELGAELYRNARFLPPSAVVEALEGEGNVMRFDSKSGFYRPRVFRWTLDSGRVIRECAGKKSEARMRDWLERFYTLDEVLGMLGYDETEATFEERYNRHYARELKKSPKSDGVAGIAFECAIKEILTPHSRYAKRRTPQGLRDITKRWTREQKQTLVDIGILEE